MFDDEENDWDDSLGEIADLLDRYQQLKDGQYSAYLFSQEDFELLCEYLSDEGKYKDSLEAIDLSLEIYPNNLELLLKKVDILMDCNRDKAALKVIKYAKEIDPKSLDLISLEVEVLCTLDKEDEAKNMLLKLLEKDESSFFRIFILQELISVHSILEDYDAAYLRLLEVLKIDETNEEALHRMTFIINKTNRQKEFISYLESQTENFPLNELIWYNLAIAYQKDKNYKSAEIAYDTVLGLDPRNESAYLGLTECYMLQKKYDHAIKHIEEYYQDSEEDYFLHQILARCYEKTQQFHKAREVYRMMAVHFEYVLEEQILLAIGETYIAESNWQAALKSLLPILETDSQNERVHHLIGLTLARLEDWEGAEASLGKAMSINEKNVTYVEDLLEIHILSEQYNLALLTYNYYLESELQSAKLNFLGVVTLVKAKLIEEAEIQLIEALEFSQDYLEIIEEYCPDFAQSKRYIDIISRYN